MRNHILLILSLFFGACTPSNPAPPSSAQCFEDIECPDDLGKPFKRHCEAIDSRENSDKISRLDILTASNTHRALKPPPQGLKWNPISPNSISGNENFPNTKVVGRMLSIAIDPQNDNHWFAGSAAAGIFESIDAGANWKPIQNGADLPLLGIGVIAIHPKAPEIIYAGTGEPNPGIDAYGGLGLFVSEDQGKNWALHSEVPFAGNAVSDIVLDPDDSRVVLVGATSSNLPAGKNKPGSSGIFRSTDKGVSWKSTLEAKISDFAQNSKDSKSIYAGGVSNNGDAQLWRSKDGGQTFQMVSVPWNVSGRHQKVMLALSPTNPNVLYVSIGAEKLEGLWKSTNAWSDKPSFDRIDTAAIIRYCESQCWYSHVRAVSPKNENVLYAGGISLWKYDGSSWTDIGQSRNSGTLHADQHALLISLKGRFFFTYDRVIAANDGGIYESRGDIIDNWTSHVEGLDVTQFWSGSISEDGRFVIGGSQDNGTSFVDLSDPKPSWKGLISGDGFDAIAGSPTNPNGWIGTNQNTGIYRADSPPPAGVFREINKGIPSDVRYLPFVTRISQCAFDANTVLTNIRGGILRSTNFFGTDPEWKPQVAPSDPGESESTALAFSSIDPSCRSYAYGTSEGNIHSTFDGGTTWQSYLPEGCSSNISDIEFSHFPNQINPSISEAFFVAYSGFQADHAIRITCGSASPSQTSEIACEGDKTITSLGFPVDIPVLGFEIDPVTDTLFAATDSSVWMLKNATSCDSANCEWTNFGHEQGLPNVPVFDVSVAENARKVVAFTHGRGAFIMDISTLDKK